MAGHVMKCPRCQEWKWSTHNWCSACNLLDHTLYGEPTPPPVLQVAQRRELLVRPGTAAVDGTWSPNHAA